MYNKYKINSVLKWISSIDKIHYLVIKILDFNEVIGYRIEILDTNMPQYSKGETMFRTPYNIDKSFQLDENYKLLELIKNL